MFDLEDEILSLIISGKNFIEIDNKVSKILDNDEEMIEQVMLENGYFINDKGDFELKSNK
jgi:hypothetical protein